MARTTTALTATQIKGVKAKDKKYKLSDGRGLFLLILPSGSKLWRLKYRFNAKEKEYAIGTYPSISLSQVRIKREELKELIANGIDPNEKKREVKEEIKQSNTKKENTFYNISQKWLKNYESEVSENYHAKLGRALKNYLYKTIKDFIKSNKVQALKIQVLKMNLLN